MKFGKVRLYFYDGRSYILPGNQRTPDGSTLFVRAGNPRISAAAGTARGHVSSGTRVLNILMGDILAYYSAAMVTHTCFAPILIS